MHAGGAGSVMGGAKSKVKSQTGLKREERCMGLRIWIKRPEKREAHAKVCTSPHWI